MTRNELEAQAMTDAITAPSCITRHDLRRVAEQSAADLLAAAERTGQNRTGADTLGVKA